MSKAVMAKENNKSKPKYIVVFHEASERNTSMLSSVLQRGGARGSHEKKGVAVLAAGDTGVPTRVYERLGVAATDLTESELRSLQVKNEVKLVVENQVRNLPPVRRSLESAGDSGPPQTSPLVAYLRGVRDAANLAIAFEQGTTRDPIGAEVGGVDAVGLQAHAKNTWGLRAIGASAASVGLTGRGVKVAVLDTGIDLTHPDLGSKVVEGTTAVSLVSGVTVQDVAGHGTHCAGVISGPKASVSGTRYGVAPDVQLLVGKVFNNRTRPTASDDDILEGIAWADDNGARVISMSLGSERDVGEPFSPAYEEVASKLLDRPAGSVLLVAAAGNESERPFFTAPVDNPAACPSILSVAAVDRFRHIASFSCRAMDGIGLVDVSAPGVSVFSAYTGGGFEWLDGTSMATPHVAGLAALYLEQDPSLTARQLLDQLKTRARALGDVAEFGAGMIRVKT